MIPKKPNEYGVGEQADGTINVFDPSELPAKLRELRELERAAEESDDLSDLDDAVDAVVGKAES